jgi:GNAT superfamily N-acetyltransferase
MPTHHVYTNDTLPTHLAYQREAFIRLLWIDRSVGNPDYTLTLNPLNIRHEVYVQNDALVSSVSILKTDVTLGDQSLVCYGIEAMITYPFWRKRGYGGDLMKRATTFIHEQPDAALGLLWTSVAPFYIPYGWEVMRDHPTGFGDPRDPVVNDHEDTMMLFVSDTSNALRAQMTRGAVYVGARVW